MGRDIQNDPALRRKPRQPVAESAPKSLTTWGKLKLVLQARKLIHQIPRPMKINGSWKTTLFGTGGIVIVLINAGLQLVDGNPATNPDWLATFSALMPSIAALFAKDSNVSNAPHPTAKALPVE